MAEALTPWNTSHIPSQHIKGSWQASYAVDGHKNPSSGYFNYVYSRPRIGKSSEILVHCRAANDTIVQWLRLQSNMEWFPHCHAVDGHMKLSLGDFNYMYGPSFGKSYEILVHCWAANDTIVQWLRFLPNME